VIEPASAPDFPLDRRGVYRVSLPEDTLPEPRLCIAPRRLGRDLAFFDTLRERVLEGEFVRDPRAPADAICFQVREGARLWLEPMTLARWREIKDRIDGRPDFETEEALRAFYLGMVE
jgi:hypothetical protein